MTVLDSPPVEEPPTQRRWAKILVALALLIALTWVVFTSLYSPLRSNGFGGVRGAMKPVLGGAYGTERILTGPENGTGEVLIGIRNDGPLPVRLLRGGAEDDFEPLVEVNWAPNLSPRDQIKGGHPDEVRPFPVTLQPGESITISVTVTKPDCGDGDSWLAGDLTRMSLRWSVLGRPRVHVFDVDTENGMMDPINVCPTSDEVQQVR